MFGQDVTNIGVANQLNERRTDQYLRGELAKVNSKLPAYDPNNNAEVLARVKHVLRKGESLMEFYARGILGPNEIVAMTKDEITRRVAQNAHNGICEPTGFLQRKEVHR